jgi:acetyltransferase-like isoleucine patch superfamily enzyme
MRNVAATAILHPGVVLGKNVVIEDYCIIGAPFKGQAGEETIIGDDALIRSHSVIYAGNRIGKNFQTGNKANIRELNVIGDDVSIGTLTVIEHHVSIEDGVRIHSQAFIPEYCVLQRGAWIGPAVTLTNARYPAHPEAKNRLQGVIIGEGAKLGARVSVLPGVKIGNGALIGASSVVTHDVPSDVVAFGAPCAVIRKMDY